MSKPIAFVWDNFGPLHIDRCEAVARHYAGRRKVIGLEISARSATYDWESPPASGFQKETLFSASSPKESAIFRRLMSRLRHHDPAAIFFCHYQKPAILGAALLMRAFGKSVFSTNDSKFDDYTRHLRRELGKSLFFLPYHGSLVASPRSRDYIRFLGVPGDNIEVGVYALSTDRIRGQLGPDFAAPPFAERPFAMVARLVPKKNIAVALRAFALLPEAVRRRRLLICGSGPLEEELRALAQELGLASQVDFRGFVQSDGISRILASSVALLLPSIEEQFGQVVEEAQALGVPVIVSPACGAADELVRSGVNGFLCEPDNPEGLAWFMERIATDEALWTRLSDGARANEPLFGVDRFVAGVERLIRRAGIE